MKLAVATASIAVLTGSANAFVPATGLAGSALQRPWARADARGVRGPACRSVLKAVASMEDTAKVAENKVKTDTYTVVLLRHGESTWNDENRFTGWADCPLSEKGKAEAKQSGELLRDSGLTFDMAYTSLLKRAINTLWSVLEEMDLMWIPVKRSWRLNERHYGALQGLDKQQTVDKHGKDQVLVWRRSYDIPPPALDESSEHYPGNDRRYGDVAKELLPFSESLMNTKERFLVEWEEKILPDIKSGKKVLIAAHGNTLRALVQHLDDIPSDVITGLNIPTGVPLVYELDKNLKPVPHADAMEPLTGHYLGDQDAIRARIEGVKNQTK